METNPCLNLSQPRLNYLSWSLYLEEGDQTDEASEAKEGREREKGRCAIDQSRKPRESFFDFIFSGKFKDKVKGKVNREEGGECCGLMMTQLVR